MGQGDEGDGVNSSQAPSVGANRVPECGGNIRGQRRCVSARNWPLRRRKGDAAGREGAEKKAAAPTITTMMGSSRSGRTRSLLGGLSRSDQRSG